MNEYKDAYLGTGTMNEAGTVLTFTQSTLTLGGAAELFMIWAARTEDVYALVTARREGSVFGVDCHITVAEFLKLAEVTR